MSEENEVIEQTEESDAEDFNENTLSDEEIIATESGWKPKDQWEGDPSMWKDAKTWNRTGEMLSKLKRQGSAIRKYKEELDETKEAIKALGEHNKKIAEMEYKKALKELRREKAAALKDEDYDAVVEIEDRIDGLKEENLKAERSTRATQKSKQDISDSHPDVQFIEKWLAHPDNSWYKSDHQLKQKADEYFDYYFQEMGESTQDAIRKTEATLKKKFPKKFNTAYSMVTESAPESVAPSTGTKTRKYTKRHLSDDQMEYGKRFVKSGVFKDIQEYVDQLAELNELPAQRGA